MTGNNAAKHGGSNRTSHHRGRIPRRDDGHAVTLELLGPLLQERNILGAFPSMSSRISSVVTRCGIEPYSAAPPRRGTLHRPSSDAEASTDRAPRPAVWASTALSSGRVVVRGADFTGGKRGAAGRAGASRGRQPLPTPPREAAGEGSGGHRRRREAREALKGGPSASRHPSGGARWAQELIQDFKVIHYT